MSYAIIETGGKQYLTRPGGKLRIEKITNPDSSEVVFDKVLLIDNDGNIEVGKPYISGAKVLAERKLDGKSEKVIVFRYHSKTRYRKKKGHRQPFTEVLVKDVKLK